MFDHIGFPVRDPAMSREFYTAALAPLGFVVAMEFDGWVAFGTPGLWPHYHANYYGAFVLDPDGHNVEAVCHAADST